ncbi:MAG: hypothetical protein JWM05_1039 [Acidimicrobiales bacterium]|nr:hypothetical protein [Acidimicrobiales bacterium]
MITPGGSARRRVGAAPATALSLLIAAVLAACAPSHPAEVDIGRAQTVIARAVRRQLHAAVGQPRCPSTVPRTAGTTFACQVPVPDHLLRIKVTVRTDKGDLRVELLDAYLRPKDVEADLTERLGATFKRTFVVGCGNPAPRVLRPGARFTCLASDATSKRGVEVTVRDAAGALDYRVLPA